MCYFINKLLILTNEDPSLSLLYTSLDKFKAVSNWTGRGSIRDK